MTWSCDLFRFRRLDLSIEYIEAYVAYSIEEQVTSIQSILVLYVYSATCPVEDSPPGRRFISHGVI